MQDGDQHLCLGGDGALGMDRSSFRSGFQRSLKPLRQHGEVQTDLGLNLLRQRGHFGAEERADTEGEGLAFDAPFPVLEVVPDAYQRIVDLIIERSYACRDPGAMALQDRHDEPGLRWEVMMNARLTDVYRPRNIGVAEGGIPAIDEKGVRRVENPFCCFTVHTY